MGSIGRTASRVTAPIRPLRLTIIIALVMAASVWLTTLPISATALAGNQGATAAASSPEAQSEPETQAAAPRQADASDIPTETVSQFVHAYLNVVDLVEQREIDLQRAETEAVSLQIQREIQAEAFELIESAGLTRQQYWQLLSLANVDPNFRERVLAQVEEAGL